MIKRLNPLILCVFLATSCGVDRGTGKAPEKKSEDKSQSSSTNQSEEQKTSEPRTVELISDSVQAYFQPAYQNAWGSYSDYLAIGAYTYEASGLSHSLVLDLNFVPEPGTSYSLQQHSEFSSTQLYYNTDEKWLRIDGFLWHDPESNELFFEEDIEKAEITFIKLPSAEGERTLSVIVNLFLKGDISLKFTLDAEAEVYVYTPPPEPVEEIVELIPNAVSANYFPAIQADSESYGPVFRFSIQKYEFADPSEYSLLRYSHSLSFEMNFIPAIGVTYVTNQWNGTYGYPFYQEGENKLLVDFFIDGKSYSSSDLEKTEIVFDQVPDAEGNGRLVASIVMTFKDKYILKTRIDTEVIK